MGREGEKYPGKGFLQRGRLPDTAPSAWPPSRCSPPPTPRPAAPGARPPPPQSTGAPQPRPAERGRPAPTLTAGTAAAQSGEGREPYGRPLRPPPGRSGCSGCHPGPVTARCPHLGDDQVVELPAAVGDEHGGNGSARRERAAAAARPHSNWAPNQRRVLLVRAPRSAGPIERSPPHPCWAGCPMLSEASPMGCGEGGDDTRCWPMPRRPLPEAPCRILSAHPTSLLRASCLLCH